MNFVKGFVFFFLFFFIYLFITILHICTDTITNLGIPEQLPVKAEVIASRFRQNRQPISDCLNVDALEPHMRERFMLTADDRNYLRCNLTHKHKAEYILDCVEERSLFVKFLESVRSETTHLGHG